MQEFFYWAAIGFITAVFFASFFEWTLHRFFMHRPVGKFDYAFHAHALVHHQTFKADHTYHLIDEKDKKTIPMAWWNGPLLIVLCQLPFAICGVVAGKLCHPGRDRWWPAAPTTARTNTCTGACICPASATSNGPAFSSASTAIISCTIATCTRISTWCCPSPTFASAPC